MIAITGVWFVVDWMLTPGRSTVWLACGVLLLGIALIGRFAVLASVGGPAAAAKLSGGPEERIAGSGGCQLSVRRFGPPDGRVILLTCGGGADAGFWDGVVAELAQKFRILVWDPAGAGLSDPPYDGCYTIERFGGDLEAVLALAEGRPALLVGHDAGALAILALCARKPSLVGRKIAGLALLDAPLGREAGRRHAFYDSLLTLDVWLSPLVRLMNWSSYANGSAHMLARTAGFGAPPTRTQLELVARMQARQSPGVRAKLLQAARAWRRSPTCIAVRTPVLVLSGRAEPDVECPGRREALARVLRATPEPVFETLETAGTLGPIEAPQACAEAIERHAGRVFAAVEARRAACESERLRARSPVWSVAAEPASWARDATEDRVDAPEAGSTPGGPIASYVIGHA